LIVEIKDGDPPSGEDTAPPAGTTPSMPPGSALTATMRESKVERRRVGFADDAPSSVVSSGGTTTGTATATSGQLGGNERSGTPNDILNGSDEVTQPINGHIPLHDTSVPLLTSGMSVDLSDGHTHNHDGSSSDDEDRNGGIGTGTGSVASAPNDDKSRGPTPKRPTRNKTTKAAMKAPTARVSALALALANNHNDNNNNDNSSDRPSNSNSNDNDNDNGSSEDPLSWLPRHGQSQQGQHGHAGHSDSNNDGVPRRSPFAISADAFDDIVSSSPQKQCSLFIYMCIHVCGSTEPSQSCWSTIIT
jgi:hypothetical protein